MALASAFRLSHQDSTGGIKPKAKIRSISLFNTAFLPKKCTVQELRNNRFFSGRYLAIGIDLAAQPPIA
jgi:hypothetical protein